MTTETKFIASPHSKESEMIVLGCMTIKDSDMKLGVLELDESDFYHEEHRSIFQSIKFLHKQGKPADIHLICERLKDEGILKSVGGAAYITSLAQYAGTSSHIEEYISILKQKTILRNLVSNTRKMERHALENPDDPIPLIEEFQNSLKGIEQHYGKRVSLVKVEDRLSQIDGLRNSFEGKKYLGLRVKSIEEFNENLLGLRKLMLLAAAPNVGKTALTIQLALETLLMEPDACLAYFSLEMTSIEIFARMNLYLSELDFRSFIFGKRIDSDLGITSSFTEEEYNRIKHSKEILKQIGDRLQIIDMNSCPYLDSRTALNYIETIKKETKCKRAIVIIDYLQVWPINPNFRYLNELEADKWRIGEMKKIRDFLNEDPILVISEARKPSGNNDIWGGDLSDVMGSARGTYTPDVVMLLSQLKPKTLQKIWEKNSMPSITIDEEIDCQQEERGGFAIKDFLAKRGIAICKLEVPKARDGMNKFSILLQFHFHKNIFKKIDWKGIKALVKSSDKNKKHLFE